MTPKTGAERRRPTEKMGSNEAWRRWGPFFVRPAVGPLVREDYSSDGDAWKHSRVTCAQSRVEKKWVSEHSDPVHGGGAGY